MRETFCLMTTSTQPKILSKNAWLFNKDGYTIARNVWVRLYDKIVMFNDALIPIDEEIEIDEKTIKHKSKGWKMVFDVDQI